MIRNKDLYGFIIGCWVPKNLYKSVKICINLYKSEKRFKNTISKAILHHKCLCINLGSLCFYLNCSHLIFLSITDLYRLIRIYTDLDGFIFERWVPINPYKSLLRITE